MAKKYVKAYFDWIEQMSALSDAEKGRLFTAILEYARSGREPENSGREGLVFPTFKVQVDEDERITQERLERGCKGELHSNWKGGITPKNQRERHSRAYAEWRNAVVSRDLYTCQLCGQHGGELNAHHNKPWATNIQSRFDISNGVTLCKCCHKQVHRR